MDSIQALHAFWSSFGLPAYDESTVPDNAQLPRITYSVSKGFFLEPVALSASLWYRTKSWQEITLKAEEIGESIGLSGKLLDFDGGKIWLVRGSPFYRRMTDEDDSIRRIYFNIEAEFFEV